MGWYVLHCVPVFRCCPASLNTILPRGSGTAQFPYLVSPLEAIQWRAREGRTTVSWFLDDWDLGTAGTMAQYQDVAIVFINSNSGEGGPSPLQLAHHCN